MVGETVAERGDHNHFATTNVLGMYARIHEEYGRAKNIRPTYLYSARVGFFDAVVHCSAMKFHEEFLQRRQECVPQRAE